MLLLYSNYPVFISLGIPYIIFIMENPTGKNWTSSSQLIHTYPHAVAHVAREPRVLFLPFWTRIFIY